MTIRFLPPSVRNITDLPSSESTRNRLASRRITSVVTFLVARSVSSDWILTPANSGRRGEQGGGKGKAFHRFILPYFQSAVKTLNS